MSNKKIFLSHWDNPAFESGGFPVGLEVTVINVPIDGTADVNTDENVETTLQETGDTKSAEHIPTQNVVAEPTQQTPVLPKIEQIVEVTAESTIIFYDATHKLQNFFREYGDATDESKIAELDEKLETFINKLETAKKVTFVDSIFIKSAISSFAKSFEFELGHKKGVFSTVEDDIRNCENDEIQYMKSTTAIPLFMQKALKKKLRIAAIFISASDCKGIIESLQKYTFPMDVLGIYLKPDSSKFAAIKSFIDKKVVLITIDCCWGKPLDEKFDYVFGFFGGCSKKPLTWQKTKAIRKFGKVKKVIITH